MIKVLIADDHAIVRSGLRALLKSEPNMMLIGEATGGHEAISMTESLQPDVLVLDLNMPDLDGIEVTKNLRPRFPDLRILILTVYEDEALLREAIRAGASGYILKRATETELISAIYTVRRGDLYVDPKMIRVLFTEPSGSKKPMQIEQEPLSPREKEVLCLIVQGYTNRQIGEILHISVRTVEGHRANISAKLGLHSRVEFVRYAREHGLID